MGVCRWRLCEETSDMILTEGLEQKHALLDIRVDQDHGGSVWKGPREWSSLFVHLTLSRQIMTEKKPL